MTGRTLTDKVTLVGLDFGSTTSSMLAVEADIANNCATGRMAFRKARTICRNTPIFTPFKEQMLDLPSLRSHIVAWLAEARIARNEIFSSGAIVTGLAADRDNADALAELVAELLGESVVATADDPRLESWLAFMGGAAGLSRVHASRPILNFDIGGGTSNPALGLNGNVSATGCYFVGARHFEFEPGSYRLMRMSRFGAALLQHLGLELVTGRELSRHDIDRILAYYTNALAAIADADRSFFDNPAGRLIEQSPFDPTTREPPALVYSGGVGELIYTLAGGGGEPPTTCYGDLGIDLAKAILANDRLARDVSRLVPEHRGRATVQGITLNSTEVSGTTLFLSGKDALPLRDLPIVAAVTSDVDAATLVKALRLAGSSRRGACIHLAWKEAHPAFADVKRLGSLLAAALEAADLPTDASLVVLTTANVGKALGNYATGWRTSRRRLLIIDEIPERNAHFVNVGRMRNGVVPVSFYGMY